MEGSATLIAHRGKGDGAALRQSGLVHKIAAGDGKLGRVGVAYIHIFGKQTAADGKRGVTFFGYNLTVKQAVADGDGSVRTHERHTLFKGPALDRGICAGGGGYFDSILKGAAGDGAAVVAQNPLEGTVGDGAAEVVQLTLEGTAGDGAIVAHLPLEGAVGDGFVVVHIPLEDAAGDGSEVSHLPLEDAAGDGAVIVGFTADGAAD